MPLSVTKARLRALPCCTLLRKANIEASTMRTSVVIMHVQLLNQSAVPDNLVQEACKCPHYQVNYVQPGY